VGFDNDHAIRSTPRDTAYLISTTAATPDAASHSRPSAGRPWPTWCAVPELGKSQVLAPEAVRAFIAL
jgi:hypothetical protein